MDNYTHLSLKDRSTLYALYEMGVTVSEIAKRIHRHRSAVYRELARNLDGGSCSPNKAHQKSQQRQAQERSCKIQRSSTLRQYVVSHLKLGWSPEQIAGRLKRKNSKYAICHETIYRYIYRKNHKQLFHYLARKKPKRRRQFARKQQRCHFGDKRR